MQPLLNTLPARQTRLCLSNVDVHLAQAHHTQITPQSTGCEHRRDTLCRFRLGLGRAVLSVHAGGQPASAELPPIEDLLESPGGESRALLEVPHAKAGSRELVLKSGHTLAALSNYPQMGESQIFRRCRAAWHRGDLATSMASSVPPAPRRHSFRVPAARSVHRLSPFQWPSQKAAKTP